MKRLATHSLLAITALFAAACDLHEVRPGVWTLRPNTTPTSTAAPPPGTGAPTAPPPTGTPAGPATGSTLRATGTYRGAAFTAECRQLTSRSRLSNQAWYSTSGEPIVFFVCHDYRTRTKVSITIPRPAVKTYSPSSTPLTGRISVGRDSAEVATDQNAGSAEITVTDYDPINRNITGRFFYSFENDGSGSAGSVNGDFVGAGLKEIDQN